MRDILFKAKRLDNGEWVKGNLIADERTGKVFIGYIFGTIDGKIEDFDVVEVNKETICQYIGNFSGRELWENDVIRTEIPYKNSAEIGTIKFGFCDNGYESHICFYIDWGKDGMRQDLEYWKDKKIEVIGNIFGGKQNG